MNVRVLLTLMNVRKEIVRLREPQPGAGQHTTSDTEDEMKAGGAPSGGVSAAGVPGAGPNPAPSRPEAAKAAQEAVSGMDPAASPSPCPGKPGVSDTDPQPAALNNQEAWAALAMIRDAVEQIAPVGAVPRGEEYTHSFMDEACAIVKGITALADCSSDPGDARGSETMIITAEGLLSASARRTYKEAKASALRAFDEATESARRALCTATESALSAYEEVTEPALRAYREATEGDTVSEWRAYVDATEFTHPARRAYNKATASARRAYNEDMLSAQRAYKEAKALAFARALNA